MPPDDSLIDAEPSAGHGAAVALGADSGQQPRRQRQPLGGSDFERLALSSSPSSWAGDWMSSKSYSSTSPQELIRRVHRATIAIVIKTRALQPQTSS